MATSTTNWVTAQIALPNDHGLHHVVGTFSGAGATVGLNLDRTQVQTAAPFSISADVKPVVFGNSTWRGFLSNVRIWNIARAQSDIAADTFPPPIGQVGVIAHWPLDDGDDAGIRDLSGNHDGGTIVGSASWAPFTCP